MGPECNFSFRDLYLAAHNRPALESEMQALFALPQSERNAVVKKWSELSGWGTKERVGTDGALYIAFCPNWKG